MAGSKVVQHGRVMKEHVAIPAGLLAHSTESLALLDAALEYVSALKPKPTRRT